MKITKLKKKKKKKKMMDENNKRKIKEPWMNIKRNQKGGIQIF